MILTIITYTFSSASKVLGWILLIGYIWFMLKEFRRAAKWFKDDDDED